MGVNDKEATAGRLLVFTGSSKDKTNAALGVALRFMGHGGKVIFICSAGPQSLKLGKLGTNAVFTDHFKMISIKSELSQVSYLDDFCELVDSATDALTIIRNLMIEGFRLLIIDDISYYIDRGIIGIAQLLSLIDRRPQTANIILTGVSVPEIIIKRADMVSDFVEVKWPYPRK